MIVFPERRRAKPRECGYAALPIVQSEHSMVKFLHGDAETPTEPYESLKYSQRRQENLDRVLEVERG